MNRIRTFLTRHVPAAAIFGAGLLALLIADTTVVKLYPPSILASWIELRAVSTIFAVICLLGKDQLIVRAKDETATITLIALIQIPLIALVCGVVSYNIGITRHLFAPMVASGSIALGLIFFQIFRSRRRFVFAQIAQQSWKICALSLVVLNYFIHVDTSPGMLLNVAILISVLVGSSLLYIDRFETYFGSVDLSGVRRHFELGIRLMFASLLLALAVYGEQLAANTWLTHQNLRSYFAHLAYFVFPCSIVNGYLAFTLGPWLLDNVNLVRNHRWIMLAGCCLGAVLVGGASFTFGLAAWNVIDPLNGQKPDRILQIILFASCSARMLDTFPASGVAVLGNIKDQNRLIIVYICGMLISVAISAAFLRSGVLALYAIALGAVLNWMLRAGGGFMIMNDALKERGAR